MSVRSAKSDADADAQFSYTIDVDDNMRAEARDKSGWSVTDSTNDFERNEEQKQKHKYIGEMGEIAFERYLQNTRWEYESKGGFTEPDFYIKKNNPYSDDVKVSVDVKTRIDPSNRDLIIRRDNTHQFYILQYVNWNNDEVQNEVESIEIRGFISIDRANKVGEEFRPFSSQNNRSKLLVEEQYMNPLFTFSL